MIKAYKTPYNCRQSEWAALGYRIALLMLRVNKEFGGRKPKQMIE
jgi:hypothetical protein